MTFDEFFGHRIKRESDCLVWQGAVNDRGYGTVRFEGPVHYAHRVAFRLDTGPENTSFILVTTLCA